MPDLVAKCSAIDMPVQVKIQEIVEALEMQFDEMPSFLDTENGRVETIESDLLRDAEASAQEGEADEDDEMALARRIVFSGTFLRLPSKFDVHDWQIMADFADSVESKALRSELLSAIRGRGAFRVFKDAIRRHRIEGDWYAFRKAALTEIAVEWCRERGLEWR